jgi:diguanylate cyclase (GGDEF)-like protein
MGLRDEIYSIRFRLLGSLFLLLGISLFVWMYGIWTFQRDSYVKKARAEAMRAGLTIEKTLRSAMLENDWVKIRLFVRDIHEIVQPSMISILAFDGRVAVSTDNSLVGKRLERNAQAGCTICHTTAGEIPAHNAAFLKTEAGLVLRNIINVPNAPECYGCHPSEQKNLGIVIFDAPFNETYTMLRDILFRSILTGLLTFLAILIVLSFIIQRFVHQPLHQLMAGFIHVGRGNFNYWVEVKPRGEFQEMAEQFNVMGRAIGRTFVEIKQKNWETASLYAFVRQLSQAIEWNKLQKMITNLLFETFTVEQVMLFLRQDGKEGRVVEISGRQKDDLRLYHREFDQAEIGDMPAWIMVEYEKWQRDALIAPSFSLDDTKAVLPLASKKMSVGMYCLQRESGKPFSAAEKKLVLAVSEQIGIALANARLYRMAITDGLTGLYAKRYGESIIRKLIDAYEPVQNNGFCVLMLDLDYFKQVNDTHGHQVGDDMLVHIAGIIRDSIRFDDVACRFGGDEFIILVAGGLEVGREAGCRLCQAIKQHVFRDSTGPALRNTVSIGVAAFPQHGETDEEVIAAADQALYEAKKGGRNQVVCFGGEE